MLHHFEERLCALISALYPEGSKRPGYGKIASDIREVTGGNISGTYLWELATGKKCNVTLMQLGILSQYFGVPPEYFITDRSRGGLEIDPSLTAALRDERIAVLALQSHGLSDGVLDALLGMVREARRVQNLPAL